MKVLLVQSYLGRNEKCVLPLGLMYIADAIEKNHDVLFFDPNVHQAMQEELRRVIEEFVPEVIGISLRNIDTTQSFDDFSYFNAFVSFIKTIKTINSEALIVVGGSGFSMYAKEIMDKVAEIDYGVLLEGEESFPELLDNLDNPGSVKGVLYRKDGSVSFSGSRDPLDLDSLPVPTKDRIDFAPYMEKEYLVGVQSKRGCAFGCTYCTYPYLVGNKVRLRSPIKTVDEVEHLAKEHGVKTFFFSDSVFNFPLDHAMQICDELIKRKLDVKWKAWNAIQHAPSDFIHKALEAGCEYFEFSPDGFTDRELKMLRKNIKEKDIYDLIKTFRGIDNAKFGLSFILNSPGAGVRSLLNMFGLFVRCALIEKNLVFVTVTNARIYPHTRLYDMALEKGLLTKGSEMLTTPRFYNPFPLSMVSAVMNIVPRAKQFLISKKEKAINVCNRKLRKITP